MHAFAALWYVCCSRSSGYCYRETVTTVDMVALLPFLLLMCCLSSSSHIPQLLQGISGFLTRPWTPAATQMGLTWRMRNGPPISEFGPWNASRLVYLSKTGRTARIYRPFRNTSATSTCDLGWFIRRYRTNQTIKWRFLFFGVGVDINTPESELNIYTSFSVFIPCLFAAPPSSPCNAFPLCSVPLFSTPSGFSSIGFGIVRLAFLWMAPGSSGLPSKFHCLGNNSNNRSRRNQLNIYHLLFRLIFVFNLPAVVQDVRNEFSKIKGKWANIAYTHEGPHNWRPSPVQPCQVALVRWSRKVGGGKQENNETRIPLISIESHEYLRLPMPLTWARVYGLSSGVLL